MNDEVSCAAEELRSTLEQPIHNRSIGREVGRGELDYEVYLRTKELDALQTPSSGLSTPDELLFQIMHQTQELWLKIAAFETVALVAAFDRGRLFESTAALERIILVHRCLANEIRILHTLTPDTFQVIRRNLGNGSGLESPGYNRVLVAADAAEAAFDRLLSRSSLSLTDLYAEDGARLHDEHRSGVKRLAELLIDWDEAFQGWLFAHFNLVRRTIGVDKAVRALDGFPTHALAPRMMKPLFPKLWAVRVEMTRGWQREGGHKVGAERRSVPLEVAEPVCGEP